MSAVSTLSRPAFTRARDTLKRAGNPFRNYFARNPDDDICGRYHVPELFAAERDLLHAVIDLYRYDPSTRSEVLPVLGNKGAGKTHLLHSIKHGGGQWQLLVTPGIYQKDTDFLEYLLFQIIDTLLGGGKQKGRRPIDYVSDLLVRRLLAKAIRELPEAERCELFTPPGIGRWARRFGFGTSHALEEAERLADDLAGPPTFSRQPVSPKDRLATAGITPERAHELISAAAAKVESHNTAGRIRRQILQGFAKAALLGDESELASFLTYGFAELEFHVKPSRQDLVLALFKVLTEVLRDLRVPVIVAFDQLEDLLLSRRSDDGHRIAEAFFAGIVQVMHQIDGLCFLVFAERGLWNRFIPSLDGYIQDRLNNPIHVPQLGTMKIIRLEAPPVDLVRRVVEARLRPVLDEIPNGRELNDIYPFSDEQVVRIAHTEPTLRDMLQQYRHLYDHMVYGPEDALPEPKPRGSSAGDSWNVPVPVEEQVVSFPPGEADVGSGLNECTTPTDKQHRIAALLGRHDEPLNSETVQFKNVDVIEMPTTISRVNDAPSDQSASDVSEATKFDAATAPRMPAEPQKTSETDTLPETLPEAKSRSGGMLVEPTPAEIVLPRMPVIALTHAMLAELWDQECRSARRKLEPEGALTGATRELQAALGTFLATCLEHGVKVGPWRLQHVVAEWPFGEHPTYGVVSIAHWACKDSQPWKVGVGLFMARGGGKPKDLEIKLAVMDTRPQMVDHLILLRPEDDMSLTGKSKTLWQDAEKKGLHARLEGASMDGFAQLYAFPRWLAAIRETLPATVPLPNLADVIQDKAEKLLEQVCMPVQG